MNALFSGTNLAKFRPLSTEMQKRVRDAADATNRMILREEAYLPEHRNEAYIAYLKAHLRMLENELALAVK